MNPGNRLSIDSTVDLYERIDATCDAFEQAWQAGQHPQIEPFLLDYPPDERASVFRELFAVELEYCRKTAETVDREAWFQRFPEFQTIIDDSFGRPDETGILAGASTSDVIPLLLPPADDLVSGQSLGRLKLLERIGEGGFGVVWRARDPDLDRQVAIKLPRQSQLSSTELNRLLEEARSVARLRHPNIATVHEVANHAGVPCIVSEFIEGDSLKDARSRWQASRDAARLCAKVARALHHAHERGVMHLDVKPANILLDASAEPHLVDFGLARRLSVAGSDAQSPAPGSIAGTPAYMAPEQVAAGKQPVDARADVYALGVVLYELLTGKRPFGGSIPQILRQIVDEIPVPPRQRDPKIPRDLEAICLKALRKDPTARYATAADFADDLERYLRGESIAARPAKLLQSCRWVCRHWIASLLTMICLLLGGVAAWSIVTRPEGPERGVLMTTRPEGAEVHFIPLDKRTGVPEPEKIVHAGRSPVNVDLLPGDYLVEVVWDDGRFHEVYRRVPEKVEMVPQFSAHQSWKLEGHHIRLPRVTVPESTVTKDMALVSGTDRLGESQHEARLQSWPRSIPSFYVDRYETTVGTYKAHAGKNSPPRDLRWKPVPDDYAVTVSYDRAVWAAECLGKRLPDEFELEFAAARYGKIPVKTTDPTKFVPVPVNDPRLDRLSTVPTVVGLCSNVDEWTCTWKTQINPTTTSISLPPDRLRILWGNGLAGHHISTPGASITRDPLQSPPYSDHRYLGRSKVHNFVGFRCVRSTAPRLTEADFIRRSK